MVEKELEIEGQGEGSGWRGLEVEEEFDLFKLGFVSASGGERDVELPESSGVNCTSPSPPPPTDEANPKRPSLGLPGPKSRTGRYTSADWSPSSIDRHLIPHQAINKRRSPSAERVIAHDFAAQPVNESLAKADQVPLQEETHNDGGSMQSTPSLASGILTSTETTTATPLLGPRKPRAFTARLVTVRRPGRKGSRTGIRITRRPAIPDIDISDVESQGSPPLEPLPPSQFIQDLVEIHGRELYEKLKVASKLHSTSGDLLPELIRDLLPTLSDRKRAVQLVNEVRQGFGIPPLAPRVDRALLQRSLAQMRERLYLELASAFILPHAPPELPPASPDHEEEDKVSMSMAPSSFDTLSRTLPNAFHAEKTYIKAALESREGMYGEAGDVVWVGGVGSMKRRLTDGQSGMGYRGAEGPGLVHVFVDHSNILHGILHSLYSSPLPLPPRHQRVLSLPCLSLLLRRGRPTRSSHLVASSPLLQDLDPLVRLNWEVSVLKRVEIYESEVTDASATKLTPKAVSRSGGGGSGTRRYKEQGVDEILTLKMLQTINRVEAVKGSTMVLATGDAKGGQFNQEGFLGAVREAVGRGWSVELWSFSSGMSKMLSKLMVGLSRSWRDTARREKWDGRFKIFTLDEWAPQLVEVNEEAE